LGAALFGGQSLDELLQHVLRLSCQALRSTAEASISLTRDGDVFTSNATGPGAIRADQAQYDSDGPCLLTIRKGEPRQVRVPDDTAQWPEFSAVAVEARLHSVLSSPLQAGEQTIGALNLYSGQVDGFDDAEERLAAQFARLASILLGNSVAYATAMSRIKSLQDGLASREIIGTAIGLLMTQPPRTRQGAFDVLRRASQRENRKLRDIASELVSEAEQRAAQ
jgi:GAF domain-containing protein